MVERGPTIRAGATTIRLTGIGTFANSTGLPPTSKSTSLLNESIGIFDGHDSPSGFVGLRQNSFSLAGGGSVVISNIFYGSIVSGNDSNSDTPQFIISNPSIPGGTLPVPPTVTTYYKMTGYYTTGAVYESFVVTGNPAPASTTNPNTGHSLINTYVAQTWTI